MFNNTFKQDFTFNSVAGTLIKSHVNSRFVRFHMDSNYAKTAFCVYKPRLDDEDIHILQVMLCGGDHFLVEYIKQVEEK